MWKFFRKAIAKVATFAVRVVTDSRVARAAQALVMAIATVAVETLFAG
jgi:hypothetical protein